MSCGVGVVQAKRVAYRLIRDTRRPSGYTQAMSAKSGGENPLQKDR